MMQWKIGTSIVLVTGLALTCGCDTANTTVAESHQKTFPNVTVTIACPGEDSLPAEIIQKYSQAWQNQTRAKISIITYDPDKPESASPEQLKNVDVWMIRPDQMGTWATRFKLAPVPASVEKVGFLSPYASSLVRWEKRYALPLIGETPTCFYQNELFAEQQHVEGFQKKFGYALKAPPTWQMFRDVAEYFYEAREKQPSLCSLPESDAELEWLFWTISAPFTRQEITLLNVSSVDPVKRQLEKNNQLTFAFDFKTGKPRLTSKGFVEALTLMKDLQKYRAPMKKGVSRTDSFRPGGSVLAVGPAWLTGRFRERFPATAETAPGFSFCPVPGSQFYFDPTTGNKMKLTNNRMPYFGGLSWIGVVSASSGRAEAAWDFLVTLSNSENSQQIITDPKWGGGPTRREHLNEQWHVLQIPEDARREFRATLRTTHAQMPHNPIMSLGMPRKGEFGKALTRELRKALTGDVSAEQALEQAQASWEKIIAEDPKKHLREYHISLGIP